MHTISEISKAFGTQKGMADAINAANPGLKTKCSLSVVEKWVKNNTVPSWWVEPLVIAARDHGVPGVTADVLARISAQRLMNGQAA